MTDESAVPASARLVRDFINTYEPQVDDETLTAPARLRDWLADRDLLPRSARISAAQLAVALRLREGLRSALFDGDPAALNASLAAVPVRLVVTGSGPALVAAGRTPADRALAALVDAIRDTSFERLKVCARHTCRWAFYDGSRNLARRWCSMAGCGNHIKMKRAYLARKSRLR
jgi:predicted RNA-binding Zn ribbon-like protein